MQWWQYLAYALLVVAVHEAGHYLAIKYYGIRPKIRIRWWGIEIGKNQLYGLKIWQAWIVTVAGIYAGYIPMFLLLPNYMLYYWLACLIDIYVLIMGFAISPKDYNAALGKAIIKFNNKTNREIMEVLKCQPTNQKQPTT